MDLLRFFTAGNVDDGKSTLIGRLLFDSNSISTDVIDTLTKQSKARGFESDIDLALLTDGLRAEREQGITIDVAYKYFTTSKRKFIIADTPGHIQYTRNMFTGASTADLAIILVDARNGITEQTKRHTIISSILKISHVVVCVNKMDLVNFSETRFKEIEEDYSCFANSIGLKQITFIPVSALDGDNVVKPSERMTWYTGVPLLAFLENVNLTYSTAGGNFSRFQVQYVIRPQTDELHDYRGYAGKILSGSYHKDEPVVVLPDGVETIIEKIEVNQREVQCAYVSDPVVIHLKNDIDVSRGNIIVPIDQLPKTEKNVVATICWMDNSSFHAGQKLILQLNNFRTKVAIKEVLAKIDIHSNAELESDGEIKLNDICKVQLKTADTLTYDNYQENKSLGSFILINENTNNTVAAGVIVL